MRTKEITEQELLDFFLDWIAKIEAEELLNQLKGKK